jgi:hypothetical protein
LFLILLELNGTTHPGMMLSPELQTAAAPTHTNAAPRRGGLLSYLFGRQPKADTKSSPAYVRQQHQRALHQARNQHPPWPYAGGKFHIFAAPDIQIRTRQDTNVPLDRHMSSPPRSSSPYSLTDETTMGRPEQQDLIEYVSVLGERAALLAMGIELFGLHTSAPYPARPHSLETDDGTRRTKVYFGFDMMRFLSVESGGMAPIILDLAQYPNTLSAPNQNRDTLRKEILARSPWRRPCAFGASFCLRSSPPLSIATSSSSFLPPDDALPHHRRARGLYGHCTALKHLPPTQVSPFAPTLSSDSMDNHSWPNNSEDDVWYMGTCDPCSTFNFDVRLNQELTDDYFEMTGEVRRPGMQYWFTYTAIVPVFEGLRSEMDDNDSTLLRKKWKVVRRMRVCTATYPVAPSVESYTQSVDVEALAMVRRLVSVNLRVRSACPLYVYYCSF